MDNINELYDEWMTELAARSLHLKQLTDFTPDERLTSLDFLLRDEVDEDNPAFLPK